MKKIIKNAIEQYQCPGCVCGSDITCFGENPNNGVGCGKHISGTIITSIGNIFLGMPNGFNRLGYETRLKPNIYETFDSSDWKYNKFNRPVWKYLNKDGHTLVRGIMPRINQTFLHIFLENCIDKIDCFEITEQDINEMD